MLRGVMHSPAHVCSVLQCLFPDIEAAKIAAKVRPLTTHTLARPQRDITHINSSSPLASYRRMPPHDSTFLYAFA